MVNTQNKSWNILIKMQFLICNPVHALCYYSVNKHTKLNKAK